MSARTVIPVILLVLGVILIGLGVTLAFLPKIIQGQVNDKLPITASDSELYDLWAAPTNPRVASTKTPMYMSYYFWNITNYEAVLHGAKPEITAVGPYVYNEWRWKVGPGCGDPTDNLYWSNDRDVVYYKYHETFTFNREKTPAELAESDIIRTFNLPLVGAMDIINRLSSDFAPVYMDALASAGCNISAFGLYDFFPALAVSDLLWGYEDNLTRALNDSTVGLTPNPAFALNNNDDPARYSAWSSQYTGAKDLNKFTSYKTWQGYTELPYWNGADANMIQGSDGVFFPPISDKTALQRVFVDDIGRSANLIYKQDVDFKDVTLYRYIIDPVQLENSTDNWNKYYISITGLFNLSAVKEPATVFLSKPYFMDADPDLLKNMKMNGTFDREKHETTIDIEPITGACFQAHKRLQLSMPVRTSNWYTMNSYLNQTAFPIFWADESGVATDDIVDQWKSKIGNLLKLGTPLCVAALIVGAVMLVAGVALGLRSRRYHRADYLEVNSARYT